MKTMTYKIDGRFSPSTLAKFEKVGTLSNIQESLSWDGKIIYSSDTITIDEETAFSFLTITSELDIKIRKNISDENEIIIPYQV
ncbi:MAG TPA: hypothetical protein PKC87_00310 [Candidatus Absconditabacterales bacterium]|nr:hypothetical protein [Candidatus Absconditabacterales bacterium]